MNIRTVFIASIAVAGFAPCGWAANSLPLSGAWSIAPSGKALSSGELLFRVTPGDGSDPVEVTVFVMSGTNETGIASNIRRALSSRLRADRFDVEAGQSADVLVTNAGGEMRFSLELVGSDVENVRVLVQSAVPVAPPTVPRQATPATAPAPATPPTPGTSMPPEAKTPPANASQPAAPAPANLPPANTDDAGGAPASAPPPNATPGGSAPTSAPPPT